MAVRTNTQVDGSTRYVAICRTVGGKQKSAGTFPTRKEADAAYLAAKAKVMLGIDPSASPEPSTLRQSKAARRSHRSQSGGSPVTS